MTNILFIHQSADLYGSDKTLLLLLSRIDRTKFNPIVVIPFDGPLKEELEKIDINVVVAPVLKLYRKMFTPKNLFLFFKQYKKALATLDELHREHQFKLIYSNTLAVLLGMIYAKKRNIKHLWHVHEIIVHPKPIAYIFPKLLKRFAEVVVCNSKATLANLTLREPVLTSKSIVIHNGLKPNHEPFKSISKKELGFEEQDVIITLIGRINRLKGHKWLLDTYLKHLHKKSHCKLLFVGSPVVGQEYYLEEIISIIENNNLSEEVKIIDFTMDLRPILEITDVVTVPSTEAESFGLVALEAMLAEKPVVGSNHGGLTEIIVEEITGFLVEPNHETALASALKNLAESPDLRKQFGQAGYQRAINTFSEEQYIRNFEALFTRLT
ncbi:glycosyltransferase family 4 protein [Flavobacterium sp.]|jgi:glycosyltransferase involved in cell wall biosynthesis|uniref:glycosyltransferase family 4 protein n=1 Tax=Flavobacterium sp. TaxID=239 RepID=UPI0037C0EF11